MIAVLLAAASLFTWHISRYWFFTEDDAFIVARYARQFALGYGLTYETGVREWGLTTTLLPFLLAPFVRWVDPILTAKIINLVAMLSALPALAWMATKGAVGRRARLSSAGLSLALVVSFAPLVLWTVGGLETGLYVALFVWSMAAAMREWGHGGYWSAPLIILCVLTRYDALLWIPIIWALRGWGWRWGSAVAVASGAVWGAHAAYYHALTPNSFEAKVAGVDRFGAGWGYLSGFTSEFGLLVAVSLMVTIGLAIEDRRCRIMLGGMTLLGGYVVWAGGDWMPGYRFMAPAIIFLALPWAWLWEGVTWRRANVVRWVLTILFLSSMISPPWLPRLHALANANALFSRIGMLAAGISPDIKVAVADIGGFGWHSNASVMDLSGLVTRAIATAAKTRGPVAAAELFRARPDVVMVKSYVGGDDAMLAAFEDARARLPRGSFIPWSVGQLYGRERMQGDVDALAYVLRSGDFLMTAIYRFPVLPQFYMVFVRASALSQVPVAFARGE